jgi:hypothetical protein
MWRGITVEALHDVIGAYLQISASTSRGLIDASDWLIDASDRLKSRGQLRFRARLRNPFGVGVCS